MKQKLRPVLWLLEKSVCLVSVFTVLGVQSVWAEQVPPGRSSPATSVTEWMAQIEADRVRVNAVKVNPTATGLEIILETQGGRPLNIDASQFKIVDNALTADIPNAVLALADETSFQLKNPVQGVSAISVTQQSEDSIRVRAAGDGAPPTVEVGLKVGASIYSLNPEDNEPDEEIVATGAVREGYRVPNSSVGTKTDTPLRDIPQSIQVVPQEVLRDQQVTRLDDALRNVAGVNQSFNFGPFTFYSIRGFDATETNLLRDGLIDLTFPVKYYQGIRAIG